MKRKRQWLIGTVSTLLVLAVIYFCLSLKWTRVVIETQNNKTVSFFVERAETPEERKQGLMYRKSLGENKGMLFLFDRPQEIRMWMQNTLIPLDMIFINDNKIVSIYQNAQPNDLRTISSRVFADAVLEINAGMVKKRNIHIGDKIRF